MLLHSWSISVLLRRWVCERRVVAGRTLERPFCTLEQRKQRAEAQKRALFGADERFACGGVDLLGGRVLVASSSTTRWDELVAQRTQVAAREPVAQQGKQIQVGDDLFALTAAERLLQNLDLFSACLQLDRTLSAQPWAVGSARI